MTIPPNPNSFIEEPKVTFSSLNIELYVWKVRGGYRVMPKWFSGNQLPPFMINSSETNLKKKELLRQNQKIP